MHNFLIMLMMFSPPQINHCCDFKNNIQSRNQNIKYWMTKHSPNVTIYKKWNWLKKKLAKVCIWFIFVKTHCFNDKRKNASSLRGSHVKLSCLPQMHWRQVLFFFFFTWSCSHCATHCINLPFFVFSNKWSDMLCLFIYIFFSCSITVVSLLCQLCFSLYLLGFMFAFLYFTISSLFPFYML